VNPIKTAVPGIRLDMHHCSVEPAFTIEPFDFEKYLHTVFDVIFTHRTYSFHMKKIVDYTSAGKLHFILRSNLTLSNQIYLFSNMIQYRTHVPI
jgi:hypothetical protein